MVQVSPYDKAKRDGVSKNELLFKSRDCVPCILLCKEQVEGILAWPRATFF